MPFRQSEAIRYYVFESLEDAKLPHGILSRRGGVSPAPWASLNSGGTVGDEPARVQENRRLSFQALGRSLESLYDVWQVHSSRVVRTQAPRPPDQAHIQADGMLTDVPGVTLFMRFADCVPILLYDPHRRVVGLVHAGWLGTVEKVVLNAVRAMQASYQSDPQDILAGIGPSIGRHHYAVGAEVVDRVNAAFGAQASGLLERSNGSQGISEVKFDLWSANRLTLEDAGVRKIELSGICTACDLEDWYSHRGERGKTGRFGALIGL